MVYTIDCVPGRANTTTLIHTIPGIVYGQCSEICGALHGYMPLCVSSLVLIGYLAATYVDTLYIRWYTVLVHTVYDAYLCWYTIPTTLVGVYT